MEASILFCIIIIIIGQIKVSVTAHNWIKVIKGCGADHSSLLSSSSMTSSGGGGGGGWGGGGGGGAAPPLCQAPLHNYT